MLEGLAQGRVMHAHWSPYLCCVVNVTLLMDNRSIEAADMAPPVCVAMFPLSVQPVRTKVASFTTP